MLHLIKLELPASNMLHAQLLEMPLKLPWSNSINPSKKSVSQEPDTAQPTTRTDPQPRCLSTQQTNMLFLLSNNLQENLTIVSILRELQKKFGSSAAESFMKEDSKISTRKRTTNSVLSISDSERTEKECWDLPSSI